MLRPTGMRQNPLIIAHHKLSAALEKIFSDILKPENRLLFDESLKATVLLFLPFCSNKNDAQLVFIIIFAKIFVCAGAALERPGQFTKQIPVPTQELKLERGKEKGRGRSMSRPVLAKTRPSGH